MVVTADASDSKCKLKIYKLPLLAWQDLHSINFIW